MALYALSWQVGFALGPALGGAVLAASPTGVWIARCSALLRVGAALALVVERRAAGRGAPHADPCCRLGVSAGGTGATIENMALTKDDPLSTDAEPPSHPAFAAARGGTPVIAPAPVARARR